MSGHFPCNREFLILWQDNDQAFSELIAYKIGIRIISDHFGAALKAFGSFRIKNRLRLLLSAHFGAIFRQKIRPKLELRGDVFVSLDLRLASQ